MSCPAQPFREQTMGVSLTTLLVYLRKFLTICEGRGWVNTFTSKNIQFFADSENPEAGSSHYFNDTIWLPRRRLAPAEARRKLYFFWATVVVIVFLWVSICVVLGVIVYIRIVYMHHTISQIFCPKDWNFSLKFDFSARSVVFRAVLNGPLNVQIVKVVKTALFGLSGRTDAFSGLGKGSSASLPT